MLTADYLIVATLLPLCGFLLLIFFGRRFGKGGRLAGPFASVLILGSFGLSIGALLSWVGKPEFNHAHYVEALTYRWIPLPAEIAAPSGVPIDLTLSPEAPAAQPTAAIAAGYLVDTLTILMFLTVTLIALLVHLFSIAYMAADGRFSRYFAYLGLFCFSMLALILSNSLVQIFVCWELVGICSYLLIGFWFERRGAATGSLKWAIVNGVGDAAFLIGLGILVMHVGANGLTLFDAEGTSLLVNGVSNSIGVGPSEFLYFTTNAVNANGAGFFMGLHWLTWAGLCLFGGAVAKSAQFPLHVWLPEAMEGPSPTSALVHGVAVVGAGVYLVARIYPILTMDARLVIAVMGCVTLVMGALIALVQTDIKRVLAYATISQVGYMMLFLGAGGYVAGLLHLFTHAFFMACLLLGAGSVIHGLGEERRMEQMGGLWRKLPITAATFLGASLALIGVPWFSGAYSKQLGLASVYEYASALVATTHGAGLAHNGGGYAMLLFWIPVATGYITAFYMMRCWWLVFGGKNRNEKLLEEAGESGMMTFPLIVLAALSVGAWVGYFKMPALIGKSLPGDVRAIFPSEELVGRMYAYAGRYFLVGPLLAGVGAVLIYFNGLGISTRIRRFPGINFLYVWLRERMFFDAVYNGVLVNAALLVGAVARFVDRYVLDLLVSVTVLLSKVLGRVGRLFDVNLVESMVGGISATSSRGSPTMLSPRSLEIRKYVLAVLTGMLAVGSVVFLFLVFRG